MTLARSLAAVTFARVAFFLSSELGLLAFFFFPDVTEASRSFCTYSADVDVGLFGFFFCCSLSIATIAIIMSIAKGIS